MPGSIGAGELLLLALVLLVVFGPKRLPEIGRSFGRGLREFKDSISGGDDRPRPEFEMPDEAPPGETESEPSRR